MSKVSSRVLPCCSAFTASRARSLATPAFCSGGMLLVMHMTMAAIASVMVLIVCALVAVVFMGGLFRKLVGVGAASVLKLSARPVGGCVVCHD